MSSQDHFQTQKFWKYDLENERRKPADIRKELSSNFVQFRSHHDGLIEDLRDLQACRKAIHSASVKLQGISHLSDLDKLHEPICDMSLLSSNEIAVLKRTHSNMLLASELAASAPEDEKKGVVDSEAEPKPAADSSVSDSFSKYPSYWRTQIPPPLFDEFWFPSHLRVLGPEQAMHKITRFGPYAASMRSCASVLQPSQISYSSAVPSAAASAPPPSNSVSAPIPPPVVVITPPAPASSSSSS